MNLSRLKQRSSAGQIMAEMGPALFLVLVLTFLPALDLFWLLGAYGSVSFLNTRQLEIVRKNLYITSSDGENAIPGNLKTAVDRGNTESTNFTSLPLGRMFQLSVQPLTTSDIPITPVAGSQWTSGNTVEGATFVVSVTTRAKCAPLLCVPFFDKVPGLGAPFDLSITRSDNVENCGVN